MLGISCIGNNDASIKRQHAHLLLFLEAVILAVLVGQRRRQVLGSMIQPLVTFLGVTCFSGSAILLDLLPESFVGSPDLTRHRTGHLRRQMKTGAYLIIGAILQSHLITHFAMCKCVLTDIIECVPIGQLS